MCQRPERAFFISTKQRLAFIEKNHPVCQRPERAFFISTTNPEAIKDFHVECQRPERAFFISTDQTLDIDYLCLDVSTP